MYELDLLHLPQELIYYIHEFLVPSKSYIFFAMCNKFLYSQINFFYLHKVKYHHLVIPHLEKVCHIILNSEIPNFSMLVVPGKTRTFYIYQKTKEKKSCRRKNSLTVVNENIKERFFKNSKDFINEKTLLLKSGSVSFFSRKKKERNVILVDIPIFFLN